MAGAMGMVGLRMEMYMMRGWLMMRTMRDKIGQKAREKGEKGVKATMKADTGMFSSE